MIDFRLAYTLNIKKLENILTQIEPIIITEQQKKNFKEASDCYLCEKLLNEVRVMDHCHLIDLYRGPARNSCSLKLKYRGRPANDSNVDFDGYMTPVVFHNL